MKHINFSGEISTENVTECLSMIDDIPKEEDIILYIESPGGECVSGDILLDVIDRNYKRITVKPAWNIGSCAFNICYKTKAKVELLGDVWGEIHVSTKLIQYRELLNPDDFEAQHHQQLKKDIKREIKELSKLDLSDKEIKQLEKGFVVVLNPNRMRKLFNAKKVQVKDKRSKSNTV